MPEPVVASLTCADIAPFDSRPSRACMGRPRFAALHTGPADSQFFLEDFGLAAN